MQLETVYDCTAAIAELCPGSVQDYVEIGVEAKEELDGVTTSGVSPMAFGPYNYCNYKKLCHDMLI